MTPNTIYHGSALDILKTFEPESVDLVVTSPPYYNAKEYVSYQSYDTYLQFIYCVVREINRILRPGRFFVINTSPVITPRKNRQNESIRFAIPFDIHPLVMRSGFKFIDDIIWVKPNGAAKNRNGGFYNHRTPLAYKPNSIAEYVMVYRKSFDRLIDWNIRQYPKDTVENSKLRGDYEKTNVWYIQPQYSKSHPAVFPETLVENIIGYYSFENDVVLDPFMGSGTTAITAQLLKRRWVGIELNEEYVRIAEARIAAC